MTFDIMAFIEATNAAQTKNEACLILESALKSVGVTACRYGIEPYHPDIRFQPINGYVFGFPAVWTDFYEKENLQLDDPIYYPLSQMGNGIFRWSGLEERLTYSKRQKMIMYDSVDAGLRHGMTQKIHHSRYEFAQANYVSEYEDFEPCPDVVSLISVIGYLFHQKFAELDKTKEQREEELEVLRLSPREHEILKWLSAGKSIIDIAAIIGISDNTVKTFLSRLYRKLGVNDKVSAVQRATLLGFVQPTKQAFKK